MSLVIKKTAILCLVISFQSIANDADLSEVPLATIKPQSPEFTLAINVDHTVRSPLDSCVECSNSPKYERSPRVKTSRGKHDSSFYFIGTSYSPDSLAHSEGTYSSYHSLSSSTVGLSSNTLSAMNVIQSMIDDPSNWKTELENVKDDLSFSDKIEVASYFGDVFGQDYNYERADNVGDSGEGVVTIEEMLASISTDDPGGVCRDVVLAQAQILTALGVDKDSIYMVGYSKVTGSHAVLVVEDEESGSIAKLNYGYITQEGDVKGGAALTQDNYSPDFGMYFRVYDHEGTPVARVPSEIGQVFNEVTNGDYSKRDISKSYALQQAIVDTAYGQGSLFTAETTAGDSVVGVALNHTMRSKYSSMEIGLSGITREGERTLVSIEQKALYFRLKSIQKTPRLNITDNITVNGIGSGEIELMYMNNTVISSDNSRTEGTNDEVTSTLSLGLQSAWYSPNKHTSLRSEVIASGYIDYENEVNVSEGYTLAFDNMRWSTNLGFRIGEDLQLTTDGTVVLYNVGTSGILSAELKDRSSLWAINTAYQAPIGDLPIFMPGSSATVQVGLEKTWANSNGKGPTMSIKYTEDLDYSTGQAYIGAGWKF